MEKNNLSVRGILKIFILGLIYIILGLIYIYFLSMYINFTPYTYAFTYLALFLSLFSALIFKSKTKFFKVVNILFFLYTLYQLFSYKADCDYFLQKCVDENRVLDDLKNKGIVSDLAYEYEQYNDTEGKCILRPIQTANKVMENGVIDGK